MKQQSEIETLLDLLDEAYDRKSWHGTNLRGSVRGLSAKDAAWKPSGNRHCIWEIVLHCAYWKYSVRRRLTGEKRGSFPLKGSNWFKLPADRNERSWREHIALLKETHRSLREMVANTSPRELVKKAPGSKLTNAFVIRGIALHDVYHAAQIQSVKKELRAAKKR